MPRLLSKKEQSENVNFVLEVEKYPCLYNYTLEDYSKRDTVDAAWEKVAKAVRETVENCKEKWRNLRTVFVRTRKLPRSGSGRKVPYYLTAVMQFIVPYIKVQNYDEAPSNLPSPGGNENEDDDDPGKEDDEEEEEEEEKENDATVEESLQSDNGADTTLKNSSKKANNDGSRSAKKVESESKGDKRKKKSTSNVDAFVEYFQEKKKKLDEPDSARKTFLLSLVPDVQDMNDCQFRFFRRNVLDAIDNALAYDPRTATPLSISSSSTGGITNYTRVLPYDSGNSRHTMMHSNPDEYSNYQEFGSNLHLL